MSRKQLGRLAVRALVGVMVHAVHLHIFVTLARERVQEINALDSLRRTETGEKNEKKGEKTRRA